MSPNTARCMPRNMHWPMTCWVMCRAICRRRPGCSCGCRSRMAKRPCSVSGRRPADPNPGQLVHIIRNDEAKMASFQARGRDPLFDTNTAATLEKRGRELIGLALVALGLMVGAMIASYTPDDPSWLSATDAPVQNWLGRLGASIAAPMFMIIGWGSWALAA